MGGGFCPKIVSSLASDPDMAELIELYVAEMPQRAGLIMSAFEQHAWEQLSREAHKIRGSAGGHGFDCIGDAAGAIEDMLRASRGAEEQELERVRAGVDELINLCRRATAGRGA